MNRLTHSLMATALIAMTAACSTNPMSPDSGSASSSMPMTTAAAPKLVSCKDPTTIAPQTSVNDVLASCGEPSYRDAWGMVSAVPQPNVIAPVEEWYYNPGPGDDVKVLRFVDGRLAAATQDGAGFDPRETAMSCDESTSTKGLSKYRLVSACGEPVERDAYVVDPARVAPGTKVFSEGTALIEGTQQNGKVAVYREALAFNVAGQTKTVTVQNGRVLEVETAIRETGTEVSSAQ